MKNWRGPSWIFSQKFLVDNFVTLTEYLWMLTNYSSKTLLWHFCCYALLKETVLLAALQKCHTQHYCKWDGPRPNLKNWVLSSCLKLKKSSPSSFRPIFWDRAWGFAFIFSVRSWSMWLAWAQSCQAWTEPEKFGLFYHLLKILVLLQKIYKSLMLWQKFF